MIVNLPLDETRLFRDFAQLAGLRWLRGKRRYQRKAPGT